MSEPQINEITITKEDASYADTGGAYRKVSVEIYVDETNDVYIQRRALVYEVLGAYLGTVVDRDTLESIADKVCDALENLE